MHKGCLLIGMVVACLATASGRVEAAEGTNQVYGTWDAIEYGGTNQLPQDTKTTVSFDTNGICTWSCVFLQTNQIVCKGKFTVENNTLTFAKDSKHIARFSLNHTNDCFIMREEEKGWDSWMKLKKRPSNQASEVTARKLAEPQR